jgi:hypothetical protein
VRDTEGRVLPISLATLTNPRGLDVEEGGFAFDYPIDVADAIDDYRWLDDGRSLAVAVGRDPYLHGAPCEGYGDVRAWWMDEINACLAAGVDGVDIRIVNHNRTFDWSEFGFNDCLVDAFRERHGIDIRREPFDREMLRRLRGDTYTGFLRSAREEIKRAGKAMHVHVSSRMLSPDWHTEMEIHFDWEQWIGEGLMDELTLKMSSMRGGLAPRVLRAAREAGIKVNFCPYLNGVPRASSGPDVMRHIVHETVEGEADGFVFYENAALMTARADGSVNIDNPWMMDALVDGSGRRPGTRRS